MRRVLKLMDSKKANGTDLRFLTMAMKIVTDLERMGIMRSISPIGQSL